MKERVYVPKIQLEQRQVVQWSDKKIKTRKGDQE
jgi:hypothetical protein